MHHRPYTPGQPRTSGQNARMHILLGKLKLDTEQRHELASQFSQGRTSSTRELTAIEANNLIHQLELQARMGTDEGKLYNMRRKVFSLAHQLGWETPDGKVDRARLDGFCEKRGVAHKPLMQHTVRELAALVTQLQNVNDSHHG